MTEKRSKRSGERCARGNRQKLTVDMGVGGETTLLQRNLGWSVEARVEDVLESPCGKLYDDAEVLPLPLLNCLVL